ncbi:MAG: ABC transporter ATP-binding protein [Mesorhizobium sp.]|uniref:ABC transporter ATP-binding protein n=1 Tax=Mesorhizobium sp. TaxID=1871066 RepID=UPI000FE8C79B|nr:ABC transporter ATP-binding protein [Mesorhizobium sp.]RWF76114.1 MAG: ABC transporter ATP-binding protein [Mesorhizobium sp.]TIS66380.1 MAG: ABC transporter ATP-binding protein [Mesorhizobium sp.]TIW45645.1 MAG: ABC transporter ATP-binding protein [Mesorhizobium sp.]
MAQLLIRNVEKSYGAVTVLDDISIEVEEGAFVVLLGPSGCGKSTLLHAIAGLHEIDGGSIVIGDRDVTDLPARERDVAMVFQSYALYPTMSVRENIGFPLKMRGLSKNDIADSVDRVAAVLKIEPLLERRPRELSGGQRQRVAIGRALVRDPRLFLFDEPLSNLDAALRGDLRAEIKRLHQRIRRTMVYVTHDQIEAMTLATKIVILNHGVVQQVGSPHEIYFNPANLFVARFIGSPPITLIQGAVSGHKGGLRFTIPASGIDLSLSMATGATVHTGAAILGLRPENIRITAKAGPTLSATVDLVEPTGPEDIVTLNIQGHPSVIRTPAGMAVQGGSLGLELDLDKALLFDPASGARLG